MTRGSRKFQPCALLAFVVAGSFVASCGPVEDGEDVETVQSAATSSVIKFVFVIAMESAEKILNLSVLSKVSGNNELADLFKAGSYP